MRRLCIIQGFQGSPSSLLKHGAAVQLCESLPRISFDYEVLEKAERLAAVEFKGFWKDLGTWDAMADQMNTDTIGRVVLPYFVAG